MNEEVLDAGVLWVPDPGSNEALSLGCTCPVIDNGYGRGYLGQPGVFVFNCGCPIHGPHGEEPTP